MEVEEAVKIETPLQSETNSNNGNGNGVEDGEELLAETQLSHSDTPQTLLETQPSETQDEKTCEMTPVQKKLEALQRLKAMKFGTAGAKLEMSTVKLPSSIPFNYEPVRKQAKMDLVGALQGAIAANSMAREHETTDRRRRKAPYKSWDEPKLDGRQTPEHSFTGGSLMRHSNCMERRAAGANLEEGPMSLLALNIGEGERVMHNYVRNANSPVDDSPSRPRYSQPVQERYKGIPRWFDIDNIVDDVAPLDLQLFDRWSFKGLKDLVQEMSGKEGTFVEGWKKNEEEVNDLQQILARELRELDGLRRKIDDETKERDHNERFSHNKDTFPRSLSESHTKSSSPVTSISNMTSEVALSRSLSSGRFANEVPSRYSMDPPSSSTPTAQSLMALLNARLAAPIAVKKPVDPPRSHLPPPRVQMPFPQPLPPNLPPPRSSLAPPGMSHHPQHHSLPPQGHPHSLPPNGPPHPHSSVGPPEMRLPPPRLAIPPRVMHGPPPTLHGPPPTTLHSHTPPHSLAPPLSAVTHVLTQAIHSGPPPQAIHSGPPPHLILSGPPPVQMTNSGNPAAHVGHSDPSAQGLRIEQSGSPAASGSEGHIGSPQRMHSGSPLGIMSGSPQRMHSGSPQNNGTPAVTGAHVPHPSLGGRMLPTRFRMPMNIRLMKPGALQHLRVPKKKDRDTSPQPLKNAVPLSPDHEQVSSDELEDDELNESELNELDELRQQEIDQQILIANGALREAGLRGLDSFPRTDVSDEDIEDPPVSATELVLQSAKQISDDEDFADELPVTQSEDQTSNSEDQHNEFGEGKENVNALSIHSGEGETETSEGKQSPVDKQGDPQDIPEVAAAEEIDPVCEAPEDNSPIHEIPESEVPQEASPVPEVCGGEVTEEVDAIPEIGEDEEIETAGPVHEDSGGQIPEETTPVCEDPGGEIPQESSPTHEEQPCVLIESPAVEINPTSGDKSPDIQDNVPENTVHSPENNKTMDDMQMKEEVNEQTRNENEGLCQ